MAMITNYTNLGTRHNVIFSTTPSLPLGPNIFLRTLVSDPFNPTYDYPRVWQIKFQTH
jgi:hypothetical protein